MGRFHGVTHCAEHVARRGGGRCGGAAHHPEGVTGRAAGHRGGVGRHSLLRATTGGVTAHTATRGAETKYSLTLHKCPGLLIQCSTQN